MSEKELTPEQIKALEKAGLTSEDAAPSKATKDFVKGLTGAVRANAGLKQAVQALDKIPAKRIKIPLRMSKVPEGADERIQWVREAFAKSAPMAAMALIHAMTSAKDQATRMRVACEILDRIGFARGTDYGQAIKPPMVVVNLNVKDVWSAQAKTPAAQQVIEVKSDGTSS